MEAERRFPIGAEVNEWGASFRVWAPDRKHIDVVLHSPRAESAAYALTREKDGYFCASVSGAKAGDRYHFELDGGKFAYPDPASRFQPEGPHGPSQLIDPYSFNWDDHDWPGVDIDGNIVYEMHVGTFTSEGTWRSAIEKLSHLKEIGVTAIEVMPVADYSGDFGWGYDGVNMFAPCRLYGNPDDFRAFVNAAHQLGIAVILDVVYNHFGPDGNFHHAFTKSYFTEKYSTEWGEALNYDGPRSAGVREFATTNASYWISEFHLDGLRLDATQSIFDDSKQHIVAEIGCAARRHAGARKIFIVAENEPQLVQHVQAIETGGMGLDGLWNDDLHHTAMVALTGHHEAYYNDYRGTPQEFISALKWGYLYQGQWYSWQKKRRGSASLNCAPKHFVSFLENHDQVANSGKGLRCHQQSNPGQYRALTALFLLGPNTPMLFQGQEFGSSAPFYYFASHRPDLAVLVADGRKKFLTQFPSLSSPAIQEQLPDPADPATFNRCKLDWSEFEKHPEFVRLHRDLIALRRQDPVLQRQSSAVDGAVLRTHAFVVRFFDEVDGLDRLLLVNLGCDLHLSPAPEPLLAPPECTQWAVAWSSEEPKYGGTGTAVINFDEQWIVAGNSALFLTSNAGGTSR